MSQPKTRYRASSRTGEITKLARIETLDTNVDGQIIATPAAGKRLRVHFMHIANQSTVSGRLAIYFDVALKRHRMTLDSNGVYAVNLVGPPLLQGQVDETLKLFNPDLRSIHVTAYVEDI